MEGWIVTKLRSRIWAVSLAWPLVTVLVSGGVGTACTDTEYDTTIVEVEVPRPPFNQPADTLNGFLGYYEVDGKQTTCGNCHASLQALWDSTKHAVAWSDLQESGGAQSFCEPCHTVNDYGNKVAEAGGHSLVPDSSYHDVQCESCHGPGLPHLQDPNAYKPLASIAIDSILDAATNGCGECHVGEHHPFVEQWAESKHGYGGEAYLEEGGNTGCNPCHEGRSAMANKFGVTSVFLEKADTGVASYQPIVCAVCHDPHAKNFEGQLRRDIATPSMDNLCITCHSRRGAPSSANTTGGSHAAQGLLVIDENVGWIPPGFAYDTGNIVGSHGTGANPRLCATCHVQFKTINDASGSFMLQSVGHLFEAIPCTDATGEPVPGPCTVDERDFSACAGSGCHGSADAGRTAYSAVKGRMNAYLDQLWTNTDGDSVMDPYPTDQGLLPRVLVINPTYLRTNDATLTVAEGALWNARLAATNDRLLWIAGFYIKYSATDSVRNRGHKASGDGVHNPFLLEALLVSSINAVKSTYNLAAPPVEVQAILPPGVRPAR
jgi:predicted CXXCH cytochrome family protein